MSSFRWGILGTGFAARRFVQGLKDAEEAIVTVVASRTSANAKSFAREFEIPTATDSYETAIESDEIDAVYVATPPAMHRDHALACLSAGKPTLVEKPFAVDAAEAREIVATARSRSVFCMEAMWTRFLPLIGRIKTLIAEGVVGDIRVISGSFCIAVADDPGNSLYNADLGGGALLHRGIYPLSLAVHFLGPPDEVSSQAVIGATGVDEDSAVLLRFDSGALAVFHASLRTQASNDLRIMGTRARVHVRAPIFRPHRLVVTPVNERRGNGQVRTRAASFKESSFVHRLYQKIDHLVAPALNWKSKHITAPYRGNGYNYEADEVMACVRQGKTESETMPLNHSIDVMEAVDSIRSLWVHQSPAKTRESATSARSPHAGGGS